jgi:hypothetical protein
LDLWTFPPVHKYSKRLDQQYKNVRGMIGLTEHEK